MVPRETFKYKKLLSLFAKKLFVTVMATTFTEGALIKEVVFGEGCFFQIQLNNLFSSIPHVPNVCLSNFRTVKNENIPSPFTHNLSIRYIHFLIKLPSSKFLLKSLFLSTSKVNFWIPTGYFPLFHFILARHKIQRRIQSSKTNIVELKHDKIFLDNPLMHNVVKWPYIL